jgi:hypothetical protein
MLRRWLPRVCSAIRDALTHVAARPALLGFYSTLLITLLLWSALGLLTLFVGVLGLVAQGLLLLVLAAAAFVVLIAVYHHPTRSAGVQAVVACGLAAGVIASCPNRAGPQVFFAVHGRQLDVLARERVDTRSDLRIGVAAPPHADPPVNVDAVDVDRLRARVRSAGAMSMRAGHGLVIFQVDDLHADHTRGFVYVPQGVSQSTLGRYVLLRGALIPMSRPGWYFYEAGDPRGSD